MTMKRFCIYALCLSIFCSGATAEIVDFEDAGAFGGDDATVTNDYFEAYGLSVSATAGNSKADASSAVLTFEAIGRDGTDGYWSSSQGRDEAFSGDLGSFFIKAGDGNLSYSKSSYFNMSIDYKEATQAASGEIWDIDGKEQYQVSALDSTGNTIASLTSPVGSLNAEPWTWSFDVGDEASISTIAVDFVAENSTLRGFAFDNFNATEANPNATAHAAPLPNSLAVGLVGLIGMGVSRWRRSKSTVQGTN